VFFSSENYRGKQLYGGKIIPNRGAWLEFDTDAAGVIGVKIDRKRRIPVTALLRVFGLSSNEEILEAFKDVDTDSEIKYIQATLDKDASSNADEGFREVYKRVRPGDLATVDNARSLISAMFFNFERYDLSEVGRYKFNQRMGFSQDNASPILTKEDMVSALKEIIRLNITQSEADDIDHLSNRRVRAVGELIQTRYRVGLARMARIARDRMSLADLETVTPAQLIHVRPVVAATQEFFSSSQLSQFMDQTNPLAELEHKRRLSAMGPGGLSRERAGFEVRDVHRSHYGRLCPITTPEGPNIGLVSHLATYARVNEFGFIETPYRMVRKTAENDGKDAVGEIARVAVTHEGKTIVAEDQEITSEIAKQLKAVPDLSEIQIRGRLTEEIEYLDAFEEERMTIGQANVETDDKGYFIPGRVPVRIHSVPSIGEAEDIDCVDLSPKQIISVTTSLIPFLEHDDANRALMGSNMQRQAVSCLVPQAAIIGTGMEHKAARDSGAVVIADVNGEVTQVLGDKIVITDDEGKKKEYPLLKFLRTNSGTCINQIPRVSKGQKNSGGRPSCGRRFYRAW
jgi:DNA-directed RNA polymerase subunit beta